MNRKDLIITLLVVFNTTNFIVGQPEHSKPPNIICILVDDLGYGYLSCQGGTDIQTPFIDGIADLVSDVNNLEESNAVVQKIMKWSAELNCHIITVIHSNFGSDKPTGHLGSFLEKKCESQIQLEVNTVNKELVTVSCKRSRGFPFETFSFKVNNHGLPEVEGDLFDVLAGTNFKKVKYENN